MALSEEQKREIHILNNEGVGDSEIARRVKVSRGSVQNELRKLYPSKEQKKKIELVTAEVMAETTEEAISGGVNQTIIFQSQDRIKIDAIEFKFIRDSLVDLYKKQLTIFKNANLSKVTQKSIATTNSDRNGKSKTSTIKEAVLTDKDQSFVLNNAKNVLDSLMALHGKYATIEPSPDSFKIDNMEHFMNYLKSNNLDDAKLLAPYVKAYIDDTI